MHTSWVERNKGFTIVELLIVVVVIAILAAITIVAFNGIQDRAKSTALSSDASQAGKKLQQYAVLNNETLPTEANFTTATGLSSDSDTVYSYHTDTAGKNFCVSASPPTVTAKLSPKASTNTSGLQDGECIENIARNTYATSGSLTSEWFGRYSTNWSWVPGASDGPIGISTYGRQTVATAVTATGRGFDFNVNLDVTPAAGVTNWPVEANTPYSVSVYSRSSVSNSNVILRCRAHTGAGAWVTGSIITSPSVNYTAGDWVRHSLSYTTPTAGYLACTLRYDASVSWLVGSTMDATALMVTKGDALYNFAAGNNPGWAWVDSQNISTSFGPGVRS